MKNSIKLIFVVTSLLLIGSGCSKPNLSKPLTQGAPPEDCSIRDPEKFLPYFTIPDADVELGEAMYIDASCSVGKIVAMRWDFDSLDWPEEVEVKDRFSPEIPIEHWDLNAPKDYKYEDSGWPLNNLAPFYQTYTPKTSGGKTMRLWLRDQDGREQVVIHTYNVRDSLADSDRVIPKLSSEDNLFGDFMLTINPDFGPGTPLPWKYDNSEPVFIPRLYFGQNTRTFKGNYFTSHLLSLYGDVSTVTWDMTVLGSGDGRGHIKGSGAIKAGISLDDWYKFGSFYFSNGQASTKNNIGSYDDETFRVDLSLNSISDGRYTKSKLFTLTDAGWQTRLIPQLSFIPFDTSVEKAFNILNVYDKYSFARPGLKVEPNADITLQNFSILSLPAPIQTKSDYYLWSSFYTAEIPQITIEFDPGTGVFGDPTIIPAQPENTDLDKYYPSTYIKQKFQAPQNPGTYTARLRITQGYLSDKSPAMQKIDSVQYQVMRVENTQVENPAPETIAPAAPNTLTITSSKPSATAGVDEITFEAIPPPDINPNTYFWQIKNIASGEIEYGKRETRGALGRFRPHLFKVIFENPGVYEVRADTPDGHGGRTHTGLIPFQVN